MEVEVGVFTPFQNCLLFQFILPVLQCIYLPLVSKQLTAKAKQNNDNCVCFLSFELLKQGRGGQMSFFFEYFLEGRATFFCNLSNICLI